MNPSGFYVDPFYFKLNCLIKKETVSEHSETVSFLVSLLSDSNQRPRDYKSRALAN